ncbi:MAG TPA: hypothetical protein VKA98_00730 [Nitrososphaeraceae archaeon]|nr:hypothetical protein [Nitrososphaeraceae archaeon]
MSVRKGTSTYSDIHPHELVASCFTSFCERQPGSFSKVSSVYLGRVSQVNDQGANLTRNAVLSTQSCLINKKKETG